MQITATSDTFRMDGEFVISRGSKTEAIVVTVEITDLEFAGRGESVPYQHYGETIESVLDQIDEIRPSIEAGITPQELQNRMPPGAARNAVDCALWDLLAKKDRLPVHELLGLANPVPVTTAFTLSLSDPQTMRASATDNAVRPILKMKLGGEGDIERVEAVRAGAPYCRIIVDANEAWTVELYKKMVPELVKLKVEMIEQPFPANADEPLLELPKPITICADESCHDRKSLPALKDRYDMVNIKLDKTGGLTEALAMKQAAREAGFQIMVGCMVGSSLAMAPALLVAQGVELADLDGPLLLAQDRSTPLRYDGSVVYPASPELWG